MDRTRLQSLKILSIGAAPAIVSIILQLIMSYLIIAMCGGVSLPDISKMPATTKEEITAKKEQEASNIRVLQTIDKIKKIAMGSFICMAIEYMIGGSLISIGARLVNMILGFISSAYLLQLSDKQVSESYDLKTLKKLALAYVIVTSIALFFSLIAGGGFLYYNRKMKQGQSLIVR